MSKKCKDLKVVRKSKKTKSKKNIKQIKSCKDINFVTKADIIRNLNLTENEADLVIWRLLANEVIIKKDAETYNICDNIKIPYEFIEPYSTTEEFIDYLKVGISLQEIIEYFSYLANDKCISYLMEKIALITFNDDIIEKIDINSLTLYKLKGDIDAEKLYKLLDIFNREGIIKWYEKNIENVTPEVIGAIAISSAENEIPIDIMIHKYEQLKKDQII